MDRKLRQFLGYIGLFSGIAETITGVFILFNNVPITTIIIGLVSILFGIGMLDPEI